MKSNLERLSNMEDGEREEKKEKKREEKIMGKGKYTAVQAKVPKSK